MNRFGGGAGKFRALRALVLTLRCASWALWHNAGKNETTVQQAVHGKWIPGLQKITGSWTLTGDPNALQQLQRGGAMVIANHQSMLDIPLLMSACGPVPRFTAKASIRRWPFLGAFLTAIGTCFIDRRQPRRAQAAMQQWGRQATEQQGTLIAGFPEGTRSKDGRIQPFKSGLFRVAAEAALPIVLVHLDAEAGSAKALALLAPNRDANALRREATWAFEHPTVTAPPR